MDSNKSLILHIKRTKDKKISSKEKSDYFHMLLFRMTVLNVAWEHKKDRTH